MAKQYLFFFSLLLKEKRTSKNYTCVCVNAYSLATSLTYLRECLKVTLLTAGKKCPFGTLDKCQIIPHSQ